MAFKRDALEDKVELLYFICKTILDYEFVLGS